MKTVTLYTGEEGYKLFLKGLPFIAGTIERKGDYKVIAPIANITEYPIEDELESYDVVKMDGVIVEKN